MAGRFSSSVACTALVPLLWHSAAANPALPFGAAALIRTGHGDYYVNPATRRFTGTVAAVGAPDADGHIVSFTLAPIGPGATPPEPNSMVGWRLTLLAGKRFASAFEVRSNTATEVTVVPRGGSLEGIAVPDVFLIEEPDPKAPWADEVKFDAKPS